MDKQEIIEKTKEFVKEKFSGESTGHDWWHMYRVWKLAQHIGKEENADMFIVELAALLHDLDDWKISDYDEPKQTKEWLEKLGVEESIIKHVCEIVGGLSFKGAKVKTPMRTIEGKVVQDADRLDAIGAIGIARTFAFGGKKGNEIYNPDMKPVLHETFEDYKKSKGIPIKHFYEKLLLLKDLMNTETAKKIAEGRHKFMELYLDKFFKEWEGKE